MTTDRLSFADEFDDGPLTLVPLVLVAGVPRVFVPEGVHPLTVTWPTSSPDPAWWPSATLAFTLPDGSTLDPVQEVLDTRVPLVVASRVDPVKGDVDARAVAFDLSDVDEDTTALLSARDAFGRTLLAAELAVGDTTVYVDTYEPFDVSGGYAAIGRETVLYTGRGSSGGAHLTSVTRGVFGSRARVHLAPREHRPVVAAGIRHLYGRRCTVWVAKYNPATAALTAPTLWFDGAIGNGTQLVARGTRWHITADPSSTILTAKVPAPVVTIYGIHHFRHSTYTAEGEPFAFQWLGVDYALGDGAASPDNGGWHPRANDFLGALRTLSSGNPEIIPGDGTVALIVNNTSGSASTLDVIASWSEPQRVTVTVESGDLFTWRSSRPFPQVYAHLHGWIAVRGPGEWERLPSVLSYVDGATTARWALVAKTDRTERVVAKILERDGTNFNLRLAAVLDVEAEGDKLRATQITTRTAASLALVVEADVWWRGVRTALAAIAGQWGADHLDDAVDWDHLAEQVRRHHTPLPARRRYTFDFEDTFLDVLASEARLNGFVLAHRRGRVTVVRLASFARTEEPPWSIAEGDVVGGEYDLKDTADGLIMGLEVEREGKPTVRVLDTTSVSEFGDGAIVKVKATGLESELPDETFAQGLLELAPYLLGPYAEPYQHVTLTLGPTYYDLEPGDLVSLTHRAIPNQLGSRGLTNAVCQVVDVERRFAGGEATIRATLRLPNDTASGWAPEALVAAGGLTGGSAVVTLDVSSGFGASCFAPDGTDGGASWFAAARSGASAKVVLSQLGALAPIADERFTVVSTSGNTVTLNAAPSAGMIAAAAGAYGVLLRFDTYDNASGSLQHDFAFIADGAAGTIPAGSSTPYRWS